MDKAILDNKVRELVERRLLENPPELVKFLPPILSVAQVTTFTYLTNEYFILALVKRKEKEQLKKLVEQGLPPFPYLIKPNGAIGTTAFGINNSRNMFINSCTVENAFSMSLGKDSTVILCNHKQLNKTKTGIHEYTIELAYVISFGDEIKQYNLLDFLDDLMAYSIKQWKQNHG